MKQVTIIKLHTNVILRPYSSAPSAPLNVTAYNDSSTSIIVSWLPPMTPNGIIRSYRVVYNRSSDGFVEDVNTSDTSAMIFMLDEFTTYQVQVFATTVAEGVGSEVVTVTTDEDSESVCILHNRYSI